MNGSLLLDYRAEHGGQPCRLIVFENGDAELRCGTSLRRGLVNWVELRDLEAALHRCQLESLPRFYDGGAPGGTTLSLRYRGQDVRVARCLTRDVWLRFPMLDTLEELVAHLNGWPNLDRHRSEAADESGPEHKRQPRVQRRGHRFA
jgi:hypothetical protein